MRLVVVAMVAIVLAGCQWVFPYDPPTTFDGNLLALGGATSCALDRDMTLRCWGANDVGQASPASQDSELATPTVVAGAWLSVAVGATRTCAIDSEHGVHCWGAPSPTLDGQWRVIAVGDAIACGIANDRTLWCWDDTDVSQVDGTPHWRSLSTSGSTLCAISDDHRGWCIDDQRGLSQRDGSWERLSESASHGCGITSGGELLCWGANEFGQLGNGGFAASTVPVAITATGPWRDVAVGDGFSCGQRADRSVVCWGDNRLGQLAVDAPLQQPSPLEALPVADLVRLGAAHACADVDGATLCTGAAARGQLGDGAGGSALTPVNIGSGWNVRTVGSAGAGNTCATRGTSLMCWGDTSDLQNYARPSERPLEHEPVEVREALDLPTIVIADRHGCLVRGAGTFARSECWGRNVDQVIQAGADQAVGVTLVRDDAVFALATFHHSCLLFGPGPTGDALCWGRNASGQIGQPASDAVPPPTQVNPPLLGGPFAMVSAGDDFTCGVVRTGMPPQTNDQVRCWGNNQYGQLGVAGGSTHVPQPITTLSGPQKYTKLVSGAHHSCVLESVLDGGGLTCWGDNSRGQLGATGAFIWLDVAAGSDHTCAIRDQELYCWGDNRYGQLGTGNRAASPPTKVNPAGIKFDLVFAGEHHTCARSTDNDLYCWGRNDHGEVGNRAAWRAGWQPIH